MAVEYLSLWRIALTELRIHRIRLTNSFQDVAQVQTATEYSVSRVLSCCPSHGVELEVVYARVSGSGQAADAGFYVLAGIAEGPVGVAVRGKVVDMCMVDSCNEFGRWN